MQGKSEASTLRCRPQFNPFLDAISRLYAVSFRGCKPGDVVQPCQMHSLDRVAEPVPIPKLSLSA